jgi:mitochondrial enoyl-[acyl-carrier protein] reductase / trans-2-enoyl-CoA reductase
MRNPSLSLAAFGGPDAVSLTDLSVPEPGTGEVLLRTLVAPVNPADLNVLEGKYGRLPPLPCVPGTEGIASVVGLGSGVGARVKLGDRVVLPLGYGAWRTFGVAGENDLVVVPKLLDELQAAMVRINPATAWCLLRELVSSDYGWVLQNAGTSGVGHAVRSLGRQLGVRVVSFVRDPEVAARLRAAGELVFVDNDESMAEVRAAAWFEGGAGLALNGVGGESALRQANLMRVGGTHVTYGAMGRQPLRVPNGLLIFKNLVFRGFWVSEWYARVGREQGNLLVSDLLERMARSDWIPLPVHSEFEVAAFGDALQTARSGARGKVLIRFSR